MAKLTLFHISDVHVQLARPGWTLRDLVSKRATGWFNNVVLGRGRRFRDAETVLASFTKLVRERKPDAVIFSGDASALGFPAEIAAAARLFPLEVPGIAVPGNHDHYIAADARGNAVETAFEPWLQGGRINKSPYPFARLFGETWLIGLNSAVPRWCPIDASGQVGEQSLSRLDLLLGRLPAGPRILVTHYPPCDENGQPEHRLHALCDRDRLVDICRKHGVIAWLCGHRHRTFVLPATAERPFVVCCAGSGTQLGRASFREIGLSENEYSIQKWTYEAENGQFVAT